MIVLMCFYPLDMYCYWEHMNYHRDGEHFVLFAGGPPGFFAHDNKSS